MTYLNEEKERADVAKRLRLERIKQVRQLERKISIQTNEKYEKLKEDKKRTRVASEGKKKLEDELVKLNNVIVSWNEAVLHVGDAHRSAASEGRNQMARGLAHEVVEGQRRLAASKRQIEVD